MENGKERQQGQALHNEEDALTKQEALWRGKKEQRVSNEAFP